MLPDSKVVDAPPHKISIEQTVEMAKDFDLLVLFTSTPGFDVDCKISEMMKASNPGMKVCFVGPPVTVEPERCLNAGTAIDFLIRREFDHQIVAYANGTPLEEIPGASFRKDGKIVNNPEAPMIENLDSLPWVSKIYKRDLDVTRYNVPFLLNPFISMYTSRGCPAMCTFCLWPQTHSGHRWRLRSSDDIYNEVQWVIQNFPEVKEIFFDDDTFNYRKERTIELCSKLKKLNFTWSCTSRVTTDHDTLKAMKDAGCRLLIVGYESGDPQILKNIKKGATIDMAERFTANCKKLGLVVHGDFIVGLPGETQESIRKTIDFAKKLDNETIQVSIAHPYPGTEFYAYAEKNNLISIGNIVDDRGNQLPKVVYENLNEAELMDWVEKFYSEYYFRPKVVWRMISKVLFHPHERRRLTKEAKEYMALRARRRKFISEQRQQATVSANAGD
jgi:hopanoid biosynthesis associated radical SAM protein HpnJ